MRRSNFYWVALAVILVVGGLLLFQNYQGGIGEQGGSRPTQIPLLPDEKRMEVPLRSIDKENIDQSGLAILEEKDGNVIVTLQVNRVGGVNNQPAHIHLGSCPDVGEVVVPLTNVVDGRSVTEINTSLDEIRNSQRPLAINVHKSVEEASVYTACGDLPR